MGSDRHSQVKGGEECFRGHDKPIGVALSTFRVVYLGSTPHPVTVANEGL